jgi:hypothetical protein
MDKENPLLKEFLRIYNTGRTAQEFNEVGTIKGICRKRITTPNVETHQGGISLAMLYDIITAVPESRDVIISKEYDTDNESLLRLPFANAYRTIVIIEIVAELGTAQINTYITTAFNDSGEMLAFNAISTWIRLE